MTDEEIIEYQRKMKAFRETEIGGLFEKFVHLHATAWRLDERSAWNDHYKTAKKAWDEMEPVQKELREKLMKLEKVNNVFQAALQDIASGRYSNVLLTSFPPQDPAVFRARTALAEKEEK